MRRETVFVHADGRTIDLFDPHPEDIDFDAMCTHLAKEPRYNGATPDTVYSVAEHLSRGTLAVHESGAPAAAAGYFLIHDFHEAYFRDETTPKKRALAAVAETEFGVLSGVILAAYRRMTERMDRAVAAAAGLDWPPPGDIGVIVERYDRIMLNTEWRDLMRCPHPWEILAGEEPLAGRRIVPWAWQRAEAQLREDCRRWLPACRGLGGWSS
jgi:hypothetical protein